MTAHRRLSEVEYQCRLSRLGDKARPSYIVWLITETDMLIVTIIAAHCLDSGAGLSDAASSHPEWSFAVQGMLCSAVDLCRALSNIDGGLKTSVQSLSMDSYSRLLSPVWATVYQCNSFRISFSLHSQRHVTWTVRW